MTVGVEFEAPHPPTHPVDLTARHRCGNILSISMLLCHRACADVSVALVSMETSSSPLLLPPICISTVNPRVPSRRVSHTAAERTAALLWLLFFPSFFSGLDSACCLSHSARFFPPVKPVVWAARTPSASSLCCFFAGW